MALIVAAGGKTLLTTLRQRWVMRLAPLFAVVFALAGCNTPSPEFRGAEPVRLTLGQSTFDVRVAGDRAQAIRRNVEWAPRLQAVAPRAIAAIEAVSGCAVSHLDGDAAVTEARLDCGEGRRLPLPPRPAGYTCEVETAFDGHVELYCLPRD
ncbi:hypothetical protein [Roseovarius salinarum]|uniref:hypothetical protein n=1 Tax=Roseovarius salinarum TaxID=1981892 RepID=UPI001E3C7ECF|nr:hypothetical protein [Roseovarius salinarum]